MRLRGKNYRDSVKIAGIGRPVGKWQSGGPGGVSPGVERLFIYLATFV